MKKYLIILICLISIDAICQPNNPLTYKSIKNHLIDFLNSQGDIRDDEMDEFTNGKFGLNFSGVYNSTFKGVLKDGLYSFSVLGTNTHVYFLIVENNQITILNIASKKGLSESVTKFIEFADRKRYCSTITGNAVSKIIETYYKRNRDTSVAADVNCEKGIKDFKELP